METEQLLLEIIRREMGIGEDRAIIGQQDFVLPNDSGLFVSAYMVDAKPFANTVDHRCDETTGDLIEIQRLTQRENIQIDLFSGNSDARKRRWEVLTAIQSILSQQIQEENNFSIFRIPTSFVNTTIVEGGQFKNRSTIVLAVHRGYVKEKVFNNPGKDYYDTFNSTVDTEDGIINFNVNALVIFRGDAIMTATGTVV